MSVSINISGRSIGTEHPPYVIAEMSANHNGRLESALEIIDLAARAGADAIKIQTYRPDTITMDSDAPEFRIQSGLWEGKTLFELYEEAHTPWDWHQPLFEHARKRGLTLFSSPFDTTAIDLLEELGAPAYKIASFEAVDLGLIEYAASTGKPLIISTGMAGLEEIGEAVETARSAGCRELALLRCVSGYPAPSEDYNLLTIPDLAERFGVVAGISDHTLSNTTSVAAVAIGAAIIEKHFTLDRSRGGPDDSFSLEPAEMEALCRDAKVAWQSLGRVSYGCRPSEKPNIQFRRSLYFTADIKAGDPLTKDNVRSIRPGHGIAPRHLKELLGRQARVDIARGTPVSWDLVT